MAVRKFVEVLADKIGKCKYRLHEHCSGYIFYLICSKDITFYKTTDLNGNFVFELKIDDITIPLTNKEIDLFDCAIRMLRNNKEDQLIKEIEEIK